MDTDADMDTDTPGPGDPCRAAYCDGYRDGYAAAERDIAARGRNCYGNGSITVNPRDPRPDSGELHAQCPAGGLAGGSDGGATW